MITGWQGAQGRAVEIAGNAVYSIPVFGDFLDMVMKLADAERQADSARGKLLQLATRGIATAQDLEAYNTLRWNLYKTQSRLYQIAAAQLPAPVMAQFPVPRIMPDVVLRNPQQGQSLNFRQLGQVEEAAAASLLLNPWFWAAVVVALLLALGVVVAIIAAEDAIMNVLVVFIQSREYDDLLAKRLRVYESCMGEAGADSAHCAQLAAQVVPTPRNALQDLPQPLSFMNVVKSIGVVAGAGLVGYYGVRFFRRRRKG